MNKRVVLKKLSLSKFRGASLEEAEVHDSTSGNLLVQVPTFYGLDGTCPTRENAGLLFDDPLFRQIQNVERRFIGSEELLEKQSQ
jgi:hypothetical protein